jgi:hypothetical protein
MTIIKGKEAVFGIQLTIDRQWRYKMTSSDLLTVRLTDSSGYTLTKELTSSSVNDIDNSVTVRLAPEETAELAAGRGRFAAYMNELAVIPPTEFFVKEAL